MSFQLTDADFDNMHHALGRPKCPTADCYRNYYCLPKDDPDAARFEATGCWDFMRFINGGKDAIYSVNDIGRMRLAEWWAAKHPGGADDPPR